MNTASVVYRASKEQIKENVTDSLKLFYYNTKLFGQPLVDHVYFVQDFITDSLIRGILVFNKKKDTSLSNKLYDLSVRYMP